MKDTKKKLIKVFEYLEINCVYTEFIQYMS